MIDTTGDLPPVRITIPQTGDPRWLAVATEIDAFGGHRLRAYESGLTVP